MVAGVRRTFTGPAPVEALRRVDLVVEDGELVTIMGPSGSGKSTLLQILGLLDRPTAGSYRLGGHDTGTLGEARRCALRAHALGFVFQDFQLIDAQTASDNVALGLLYRRQGVREASARAREALAAVGLDGRGGQPVRTMSGGERQRVAIARAFVGEPAVILCDEPTGNLDSASGAVVMDLLGELNERGATVVVITHDARIAARGTRQLRIVDGLVL